MSQLLPTLRIPLQLEEDRTSGYFVRRRSRVENPWKTIVYHHYPKLGVVCSTDDHFVFAAIAGRGPRPDVDEFRPLVAAALRIVLLSQLAADAGYDSEGNHEFARDEHGIRTIIPAKHGRPTDKLPSGRYRRLMKVRFDRAAYRRRSQVETVVSMIKRRQGNHVHARTYHNQCRELRLIVLTHNIMILVVVDVFYTAVLTHFPDSVKQIGQRTAEKRHLGVVRALEIGREHAAATKNGEHILIRAIRPMYDRVGRLPADCHVCQERGQQKQREGREMRTANQAL